MSRGEEVHDQRMRMCMFVQERTRSRHFHQRTVLNQCCRGLDCSEVKRRGSLHLALDYYTLTKERH